MAVERDASFLKFRGFCCCMFLEDGEVLKGRSTYDATTSELTLYHRLEVRDNEHRIMSRRNCISSYEYQDVLVSFTVPSYIKNGQIFLLIIGLFCPPIR